MREILFRGKQKGIMNWVEGTGVFTDGINTWLSANEPNRPIAYGLKHKIVLSETVGQFTGLTDKNGKKIFEGDVLQFNYTGKNHGVEGKATVIFEHGKFGVLWGWHKEIVCLDGFADTTIEVIGNIHDNPELLENP